MMPQSNREESIPSLEGAVRRGWLYAAGPGRKYAPAAAIGRFCAAPQLHR
jgi:hypothetical protein